jgi:hypothetical protein
MDPSMLSLMPRITIGIFTCKKNIALLILFSALLISCRFDLKPTGVYTGTYTAPGLPVPSGTGTVTIVEVYDRVYDITFSSAGNPDVFFYNKGLRKIPYFRGKAVFKSLDSYPNVYIDEYSNTNGPWFITLYGGGLNFKGNQ